MLKNILVPLDGSELSAIALDHARNIIGPGGRVTLLTVITPPDDPATMDSYIGPGGVPIAPAVSSTFDYKTLTDEMVAYGHNYLKVVAAAFDDSDIQVEYNVTIGIPARVITETARQLRSDAIIMCTHGRSGLSRWILGSVTQNVLSAAPCPVYVVPPNRETGSD